MDNQLRMKDIFNHINSNLGPGKKLSDFMDLLNGYTDGGWRPFVKFKENGYSRILVYAAPHFDMYLLCWNQNEPSPIHDHPENGCLLKVLSGKLREERYDKEGNKIGETIMSQGEISYQEGREGIHRIVPIYDSVSLHIYSPAKYKFKEIDFSSTSRDN